MAIDLGTNSLSEPVTADLDNDGDLELLVQIKWSNFCFHHDGTFFNHFPTTGTGEHKSSLAIGDIDNDGDFEIAIATTMGLKVMDIKSGLVPECHGKCIEIGTDLVL